jgi:hypothetical protein
MVLVKGDDLSQRIARDAIPIDEAPLIATQIAEALESAHERGSFDRHVPDAPPIAGHEHDTNRRRQVTVGTTKKSATIRPR